MTDPLRIFWTRSLDAWTKDRSLFGDQLQHVTHLPCIQISPVSVRLPSRPYAVVAITSPTVADHLDAASLNYLKGCQRLVTFGAETTTALARVGLALERPPGVANGAELTDFLNKDQTKDRDFLFVGAKHPAYPMADSLRQQGWEAESLTLYETRSAMTRADGQPLTAAEIKALKTQGGVVCFASPSAVKGFASTLQLDPAHPDQVQIACCIGTTTENAANPYFARTEVSPEATLVSLSHLALRLTIP